MESPSCPSVGELICVRRNGHLCDWRLNPHFENSLDFFEDSIFGLANLGWTGDTDAAAHVLWWVQRWVKLEEDSHDQSYSIKKSMESDCLCNFFYQARQ